MERLLFIAEDNKIIRDANRILQPWLKKVSVTFVQNSNVALNVLKNDTFDIVITDIAMSGVSGTDILQYVRKRSPKTVRIVLSKHANVETILRTADLAHQFISKPFDENSLTSSISKALSLSSLIKDKKLRNLVLSIKSLPSFPTLYLEIVEELQDSNPSADKVGEIISRDMSMSAKVLQLVNSAYFGLSRSVSSPAEAAVILGLETIRDLVLTLQLFSQFDQTKLRRLGMENLWDHSIKVGLFSRMISKSMTSDKEMINCVFLAGLLHDLGKLVLVENYTMKYYSAIGLSSREHLQLYEAERETFGIDHAILGAYLLGCWGLPIFVIDAIRSHHVLPQMASKDFTLGAAVHAANVFDHEMNKSNGRCKVPELDVKYLTEMGVAEKVVDWQNKCRRVNEK